MPRYDYKCFKCGAYEIIAHDFHAEDQHSCSMDNCNGIMQKLISPASVHFKGTGFYKTGG